MDFLLAFQGLRTPMTLSPYFSGTLNADRIPGSRATYRGSLTTELARTGSPESRRHARQAFPYAYAPPQLRGRSPPPPPPPVLALAASTPQCAPGRIRSRCGFAGKCSSSAPAGSKPELAFRPSFIEQSQVAGAPLFLLEQAGVLHRAGQPPALALAPDQTGIS